MTHRTFSLTAAQASELLVAQTQINHGPTCIRLQAVRLYGLGHAVALIQTVTRRSRPSLMEWCAMYRWQTPIGRATVQALQLDSDPDAIEVRRYWVLAGWHPPSE